MMSYQRVAGERRAGRNWEFVPAPADHYEHALVPALFEPWAHDLVDRAEPRPGERILDLACGTGIVARAVAPRVGPSGTVTAVDVNAEMLAVARQVSGDVHPPVTWKQADARHTGLPDAAFDVAFCQQGLQFFPDRAAALRELRRVLAPGGRVAVSVWTDPENPGYVPIRGALERHLPDVPEAAGFVRAIFSLADAEELHDLLTGAGLGDVRITPRRAVMRFPSPEAWVRTFLAAAPIPGLATLDPAVVDTIVRDAASRLHTEPGDDGLRIPIEANIAVSQHDRSC